MARYNEILVGRFARGVQKLFGMKGEVPVGSLAGEMVISHNFFNGRENRYLEGWDQFALALTSPAGGAGNFSVFNVHNPLTSNVIAVFERITIQLGAADTGLFKLDVTNPADLASPTQGFSLDTRGRTKSSVTVSSKNNSVALGTGNSVMPFGVPNAQSQFEVIFTDIMELPLNPGSAFTIAPGTANEAVTIGLLWRERALEESERT